VSTVGLLDRITRHRGKAGATRSADSGDARHLRAWAAERRGVEAYVEPPTVVTGLTVVLVAYDGEWTRRRIHGEHGARRLGTDLAIPVYDVHKVGYPQRMRDHDARARVLRERERRSGL